MSNVVVLDVGKTLAKLTLCAADGTVLARDSRPNARATAALGYPCLDVRGIEEWLLRGLAAFAARGPIAVIIPVAHGAAAVLVDGEDFLEPLDYEAELPPALRDGYAASRDSFTETGSPVLPAGLNLGAQLHWLAHLTPQWFERGTILTWPQFWAWRLSGVAALEVTSIGCHTDLWLPIEGRPSPLAVRRGWARRFAPLRRASDILGPVTADIRERCGLRGDCAVLCGIHDSNADFLAVRAHPEIGGRGHTVLSTGTWFIAMRCPDRERIDCADVPEDRDCLVNVDAFGVPYPSARFMGGRETEILEASKDRIDITVRQSELVERAAQLCAAQVFALPAFQKGVGPFARHEGRWIDRPADQLGRRAAASLYLALMADTSLDLIGSRERLIIEGRFIEDVVFTRALASLRPSQTVYLSPSCNSVSYGAVSLFRSDVKPEAPLSKVAPLPFDIAHYAARWRSLLTG